MSFIFFVIRPIQTLEKFISIYISEKKINATLVFVMFTLLFIGTPYPIQNASVMNWSRHFLKTNFRISKEDWFDLQDSMMTTIKGAHQT